MKNFILFFFISYVSYAQIDSIQQLDEVKIYGYFSKELNAGYQVSVLKDSLNIVQNLNDVLQENENIYFKQYGNGMVSSISFRGTTAQHTAVYYNGIPINSSLNGQTDFNTISANNYNQINIKKGGGSSVLGSGAIGGAINLQDNITYNLENKTNLNFAFGSYKSIKANIANEFSTNTFYNKTSASLYQSDNEYPFLNTNLKNENGEFKNHHIKTAFGYKLNSKNQLEVFFNYSYNNRNLSRTITTPSNAKLIDKNYRFITSWKYKKQDYNATLKLAFLQENYQYYFDKNQEDYSYGKAKNYILKYDFNYRIHTKARLIGGVFNNTAIANGSNLISKTTTVFEAFSLLHYRVNSKIKTNISIRKGFSSIYKIPFIYAFDSSVDFSKKIHLKINHNSNYRLPTFNDLYWNPGGNPNLKPEFSTSSEINLHLNTKNIDFDIGSYFTKSSNLIQWQPVTNTFWQPVNIQNVKIFGSEFQATYKTQIKQHLLKFNTQVSYAISKDTALDKELIYIPNVLVTNRMTYQYNSWFLFVNQRYNGKVYTTSSNTNTVSDYFLYNLKLIKTIKKHNVNIILKWNNIFNKEYQIIAFRPMPNQNFEVSLNYKF